MEEVIPINHTGLNLYSIRRLILGKKSSRSSHIRTRHLLQKCPQTVRVSGILRGQTLTSLIFASRSSHPVTSGQ